MMEKSKNSWQKNLSLSYTKRINDYPFKNALNTSNTQNLLQNNTRLFDSKKNFHRLVKIDKIFKGVKTDNTLDYQDIYKPINSLNENFNSSIKYSHENILPNPKLITNLNYNKNTDDKNYENTALKPEIIETNNHLQCTKFLIY